MLKQNGLISAEPGLKSSVVTASSPLKRKAIVGKWRQFFSVQMKRERAYLCTDVCHSSKHRWCLLFTLHLDSCMHRATVISPLWAEVTSCGVALVQCLTFCCEELVCSLDSTFPGTFKEIPSWSPCLLQLEKADRNKLCTEVRHEHKRIIQHKGRAGI